MSTHRRFSAVAASVALAALAVLGAATSALAYPATATTALNVRTGPGTQFAVAGVLQRDETVEVVECNGAGWCAVETPALNGWASSRYLSRLQEETVPSQPAPEPQPQPGPEPQPDVTFSIETPDFGFSVGSGERPGYRPPVSGRVCFHDSESFGGRQFCAGSGDQDFYLPNVWNDVIRSVSITGGAEVTICSGTALSGECATLSRSAPVLGVLASRVSSYRVAMF